MIIRILQGFSRFPGAFDAENMLLFLRFFAEIAEKNFLIAMSMTGFARLTDQVFHTYSFSRRSLRAFEMTETELKVMAALAIIGLSSRPNTG